VRLAAIDLGSNTVRLLVADVRAGGAWNVLDQDQKVTRLGEGLAASGRLGLEPMSRTVQAVAAYVSRAQAWAVDDVCIVATSAVREAVNGPEVTDEIARITGRHVRVVSGEDEARLTLRGVLHGLGPVAGSSLMFDIGGGSTEYILARDGALLGAVSLRLGVVPLAEAYPFPGQVEWSRYARLEQEVADRLARELPALILGARPECLVGTAGTVTTLAALDLELAAYDPARVQGHRLTRGRVRQLLDKLGSLTVGERARLPCLEPGRADLIVPGVAIVRATMDRVGLDTVVVSDAGLREGILADALAR
jgi:exopolyphosphatase/guanosine-5'-triphosphate,3'-diphosphate pyrophosphatase